MECRREAPVFDLAECSTWIADHQFKRVALQLKQADLPYSVDIVRSLQAEQDDIELFVILSPSCSVDYVSPLHLSSSNAVDAIICFGDSCLPNTKPTLGLVPVLFIFDQSSQVSVEQVCNQVDQILHEKPNQLILYDVCYARIVSQLNQKLSHLTENVARIHKSCENWSFSSNLDSIVATDYSGNIFGHFSLPRPLKSYESVVWIGTCSNLFFRVNSPTELTEIEPASLTSRVITCSKELMKRISVIEKVKEARQVGIVFSNTLQDVASTVSLVREISNKTSIKTQMISLVQFVDECKIGNFGELDAFVIVTACNCAKLIQSIHTNVPLVTLHEFEIALGLRREYGNIIWNETASDVLQDESSLTEKPSDMCGDILEYQGSLRGTWYGLNMTKGSQSPPF
ncbi:2-(3-amino-3-carboxypropyl)histidine synthase subunit 2 [Halotydeus destructor]|nr:2-(3-amino-3-carboxypropyl)histidine synthase subunit 2 [Halotydeus destructor]